VRAGSGAPWGPHTQAEDEDEDHAGLHPTHTRHAFASPVTLEGGNERN